MRHGRWPAGTNRSCIIVNRGAEHHWLASWAVPEAFIPSLPGVPGLKKGWGAAGAACGYRKGEWRLVHASSVPKLTPFKLRARSKAPRASATGFWEPQNDWESIAHEVVGNQGASRNEDRGRHPRGQEEREVLCRVEVVSWRERHISASICIETSPQRVWDVLTDYERLSEFIPNLVRSEIIPCPHPGRLWVLQQGLQTAMYWQIQARVVLDLQEFPRSGDGGEIRFSMVDGDFKRYAGKWFLKTGPRLGTTLLHYEVNVTPKLLFPAAFMERIIRADLPVNLRAVAERAETDPRKGASRCGVGFPRANPTVLCAVDANSSAVRSSEEKVSVPSRVVEKEFPRRTVFGWKRWRSELPPWNGLRRVCSFGRPCSADEVHLRRFDDLMENGGVHRRVLAAITVQAPIEDVWTVLTAYECLPQFIPNLAVSKILSVDTDRKRLLQEGCKCLLYMVLHARVVLDLWERPPSEIAFEQVEGDFESFSGSWTLEKLGNEHTLLKYAVDTKMHKDCLLAEAIVEEVIYEDLPANLCAIRDRVEVHGKHALQTMDDIVTQSALRNAAATPLHPKSRDRSTGGRETKGTPRRRRPIPGLQRNYDVLESELGKFIAEHGKPGIMPMRYELRKHGRVDLEKAIARMGGSAKVAEKMKLTLAYKQRKPKGYWDELENISREILMFQEESGKDTKLMPTRRSLEKAGRYDLARALEKWGGLQEVANHLGLHVRWSKSRVQRQQLSVDVTKLPAILETEGSESAINMPYKIAVLPKSTKWLTFHRD